MAAELHPVESCPRDADSWLKAGIRLKCPNNNDGRNLYQCAPNEDKTDLVEFCLKGSIGLYGEGLCLFAYPNGYIDAEECKTFVTGCPEKPYISNEIHNYPACLEINREAGCYVADPKCPSVDSTPVTPTVSYQDGLGNVTSTITNVTNPAHSNPQDSVNVAAAVASLLSIIVLIMFGIFLFFWCRRRLRRKRMEMYREEETSIHLQGEVNSDYLIKMYEPRWKTSNSERIGSLPHDQKCILYSLLSYNNNKINRSDSEQWLSTLNDIRKKLFGAENVSINDTEKDINILMDIDLIHNDDQYFMIKHAEYVEDVIYQLWKTTGFRKHSYMLTLLSVTIVRKYCRIDDIDQIRRGGKLLYCGDYLSRSLVYRLQMDILTHPTIEAVSVQNEASWILSIPWENLRSQERRTVIYNGLIDMIGKGDTRILGAVNWTRMTREERGQIVYKLRPQCARSTIGRHDHNDIFVVKGIMYALKDHLPNFKGYLEDLYAVLLSDRFSVPFDERFIFDGITEKSGDVVRFVSDEIRHKVMYSYVVRKLLTDDDMRNFINEASVDSLMEYGRHWCYKRKGIEQSMLKETNPRLFIPEDMEQLYFKKLGYVAMKHVIFDDTDLKVTTWKEISKMNGVPFDLCIQAGETRNRFVEYVHSDGRRQEENVQSLKYMYSSFLFHNYMDQSKENIGESTWPILLAILMSDGYQIKNNVATIPRVIGRFLNISADQFTEAHNKIGSKECLFKISGEQVTFASTEIQHAVMGRFVETCLKSDEDLEAYIEGSSIDSLMEYCRLWDYKRDKGEACVFIPPKLQDEYIKRLDQDAIIHVMVEDREDSDGETRSWGKRRKISELNHIPREILNWNLDERKRYVENTKKGVAPVYRARGMIVGCARAGKTTLLRTLQGKTPENVESTVGLDVYTDLFEVDEKSKTLKDISQNISTDSCLVLLADETAALKTLSMTDFAGQSAYYACHQVYLSNRAFYILVVDMSKDFKAIVSQTENDQERTHFQKWTYQDYFVFWLKSISTYCDEDAPVILVASHCENNTQNDDGVLKTLRNLVPDHLGLHRFLKKCFRVGFGGMTNLSTIEKIEEAIVKTILHQKQWGETIPVSWFKFDGFIIKERNESKILTLDEIKKRMQSFSETTSDLHDEIQNNPKDMLRFFHEIGKIIYFNEDGLDDKVIMDVQWFVNAFKEVITDKNHTKFATMEAWREFDETGVLEDGLLREIWRNSEDESKNFEDYKDDIIVFMERLGLLVNGKGKPHLIPSVTKRDYEEQHTSRLASTTQKTSLLYFHFDFLPLFVYHRLVVSCFSFNGWEPLTDEYKCIYKDVSEFKFRGHFIFLGVEDDDIRLQVYRPHSNKPLDMKVGWEIRETVEKELQKLTRTFHKNIKFLGGFYCMPKKEGGRFISEEKMKALTEDICPRHETRADHKVKKDEFLWPKD